jgi:hypothetical protein
MFRGPLRLCLGRQLVFHRFDQGAHGLDATSHVQPIEAKFLSFVGFPLF